jgi:electron transfer flavoprotein beta subunit
MQVLVPVKHVIDYNVQIQIKDGHVVHDQVKHSINPFDEIALEEAIRLKEKGVISGITVVSMGPPSVVTTLRHALALGADQAIHIDTAETTLNTLNRAEILMQLVNEHAYDLVLMGKQAIDDDASQTPQMLAALLDWPQATFASSITPGTPNWAVTREIDGGLETLSLPMPAVISVDLRLNEPRFASLPNIMKAKSKPCHTKALADFNLTHTDAIEIIDETPPAQRQAGRIVADLDEFITIIKEHCQ